MVTGPSFEPARIPVCPLYELNSIYGPGAFLQTAAPATQLHGSQTVGWLPVYDIDQAHDPGPLSSAQSLCDAIQRKAGVDNQSNGRVAVNAAQVYCGGFLLLQQALRPDAITPAAFAAGYAGLRSNYVRRSRSSLCCQRSAPTERQPSA